MPKKQTAYHRKEYHCYQCGSPIRFFRNKDGKVLRAECNRVYFIPGPEGEGEQYVTTEGTVFWGTRRLSDGRVGYKKHNCPYAKTA